MIPAPELWAQFGKGLITENKTVYESINDFKNNKEKLEQREEDDLSDDAIDAIYRDLAIAAKMKKVKND